MSGHSKSPARIVFIGGSNVYGEGDPLTGGFVARFRSAFVPGDERRRVFNLGVGGDKVRDMLRRAKPESIARRPHLIFLYPGLNDIVREGSPTAARTETSEYVEILQQLAQQLMSISPLVMLTSIPIDESRTCPFRGDSFLLDADAVEINRVTCEVATDLGIDVYDIYSTWRARSDVQDFSADGVHCNPVGHALLANELCKFLNKKFSIAPI